MIASKLNHIQHSKKKYTRFSLYRNNVKIVNNLLLQKI